jgi:hypothetical protein
VERRQGRAALGEEAIADGEELQRFGRCVAHPVVVTGDGGSYGACDCAFAARARATGQSQSVDRRRAPSIDATAAARGLSWSVSCRAPLGRRSKNEG